MKETNMEHFRSDIKDIMESSYELPCLIDGKLQICNGGMDCCKCEFSGGRGSCGVSFVKWLMSEYKPEPVLTAREKRFVEFVQEGWLARDAKYNILYWYKEKPTKDLDEWQCECFTWQLNARPVVGLFPFITWKDEEPWAVEELRKLKVQDAD